MEVETLPEPLPVGEPTGVWAELVAALDAGGTMMQMHADVFREALNPAAGGLVDWQAIAMRYGLSEASARAMGIATEVEGEPTIDEIANAYPQPGEGA